MGKLRNATVEQPVIANNSGVWYTARETGIYIYIYKDPVNFYCQLSVDMERLNSLMSKIQKYTTALTPDMGKLRNATVGQPVIANNSGVWYTARVTGI